MPTNFWLSTAKTAFSRLGTRIRGGRVCLTDLSVFRGIVCRIAAGLQPSMLPKCFEFAGFSMITAPLREYPILNRG